MQIVNIQQGKVVWWAVADEFAPEGGFYLPDLINLVRERYSFVVFPESNLSEQLLTFKRGKWTSKNRQINIEEMIFRADNLYIAVGSSTSDAEDVLRDVLEQGKPLGFRPPTHEPRLLFQSVIVCDFDESFNKIIAGLEEISNLISAVTDFDTRVDLFSIVYGADPKTFPIGYSNYNPTAFKIERKGDVSYDENRLWCEAYMRTDDHIRILEHIEKVIASQG